MKVQSTLLTMAFALAGLACATVPDTAHAGEAHVCHSKPMSIHPSPANPQPAFPKVTDKTKFTCPEVGTKTIPQLAKAGWSIVQLVGSNGGGNPMRGGFTMLYTLIIQRDS